MTPREIIAKVEIQAEALDQIAVPLIREMALLPMPTIDDAVKVLQFKASALRGEYVSYSDIPKPIRSLLYWIRGFPATLRNVVHDSLYRSEGHSESKRADHILHALTSAGYRILGPDDLDEKTVEKAATLADLAQAQREQLYSENGASINAHKAVQAEEIATAIRTLRRKP